VTIKSRQVTDDALPPADRDDATTGFVWPPPDDGSIQVVEVGQDVQTRARERLPASVPAGKQEVSLAAEPPQTWAPPLDLTLSRQIAAPPAAVFDVPAELPPTLPRPAVVTTPAPRPAPPSRRTASDPAAGRSRARMLAALAVVTARAAAEGVYIFITSNRADAAQSNGIDGTVAAVPVPTTGSLVIKAPAGAQVAVDGRDVGVGPQTVPDLHPGDHEVVITSRGRTLVSTTAKVDAGATVTVDTPPARPAPRPNTRASAAPAPPSTGRLVFASPLNMNIYEDATLIGTTAAPPELSAGPHTLRLDDPTTGYSETVRTTVRAGGTSRVTITPPSRPVSLNAIPWADVFLNGKKVGETPTATLTLQVGTHTVVFRHPTLGEQSRTIVVRADRETRETVDLRK
jgi:PEGA domain